MLDAVALITSFMTGTYAVTRRAVGTYTNGIAVAGSTSTLSIIACIQPANGRDLQRLPEGRRSQETRVVYTPTALLVGEQGGSNADLLSVDGATWEVQSSEPWPADGGYCRAIIQGIA